MTSPSTMGMELLVSVKKGVTKKFDHPFYKPFALLALWDDCSILSVRGVSCSCKTEPSQPRICLVPLPVIVLCPSSWISMYLCIMFVEQAIIYYTTLISRRRPDELNKSHTKLETNSSGLICCWFQGWLTVNYLIPNVHHLGWPSNCYSNI